MPKQPLDNKKDKNNRVVSSAVWYHRILDITFVSKELWYR